MDYPEDEKPSVSAARKDEADRQGFIPTNSLYNSSSRPRRDQFFSVAYGLLLALTVFWGIAAFTHTDKNFDDYSYDFYYNSTSCDVAAFKSAHPDVAVVADHTFTDLFERSITVWLPITAVLGIASSVVYVLLFRKFAQTMVYVTVAASLAVGYIFSLLALISGAIGGGIILLVMTVIMTVVYYLIRDQLKMCARLLSVAGKGLNDNLMLVPAALGMKIVGVGALVYMFAAFICGIYVGHAKPTPGAIRSGVDENGVCTSPVDGSIVQCCQWETKSWAAVYCIFCAITLSWTSLLILQIKLFTVADTIAQWYFAPRGNGMGSYAEPSRASVGLAFRHCITSSFGSVAFAAAILTLLRALRNALERASRQNVFCCILNCIVQPLLALAEKFTRFATIACAITGDAFVPAARGVFDTLSRNFLQTYSLWWVPDMVLGMSTFLFSLTWSVIVFFATYTQWKHKDDGMQTGLAFATAAVCFGCIFYILHFLSSLLLDIVNTVYICYAMDKDTHHITNPEIHAIYSEVPTLTGPVIENPDGNMMYGAPDAHSNPNHPPPYPGQPQPMYAAPPGYGPVGGQQAVYAPAAYPAAPYPASQQVSYGYGHNNV